MAPRASTTVPAWRIVEPLAVPQLRQYYDEAQRCFGVPWSVLAAVNYLAANGAADGTDARLDNALFRYNNDTRYVRGVRHYAALMQPDERAFLGFHADVVRVHVNGWQLPPTLSGPGVTGAT